MQLPVTMHMAQKYAVSKDNPGDVFTFLHKNFGCSRRVYNLCVDSLYRLPVSVREERAEAANGASYRGYLISPEAERRREAGAAPQPAGGCPYRERHPVHGGGRVHPGQHLLFLYAAGGYDTAGSRHWRDPSGRDHFPWAGLLPEGFLCRQ